VAFPGDGTTHLPVDDGTSTAATPSARYFWGLADMVNSIFKTWRGTTEGHGIVQIEKGAAVSTQKTVGTSSTLLLAANTLRKKATFYNNGTVTIYVEMTGAASTTTSYAVPAGAEFADDTGTAAWNAISGTAGQDVRVMEYS
jgi:hypothetical protein